MGDPLTYAEALPTDLLPFTDRNDPYFSIGTAFALGGGRFVSAGHVLSPSSRSLLSEYALRDAKGIVHPLGRVLAYSHWRDYIVFEVPGLEAEGLKVSTSPRLDSKVFSVGNALGEGIVIREGLLTSRTREEWKGAWEWLRFSSPASPGNSGGPLVDETGKVLGIVIARSENENLNIALPMGEVAQDALAHLDWRFVYSIPNFAASSSVSRELHKDFKLPLGLGELREEMGDFISSQNRATATAMAYGDRSKTFPYSKESAAAIGDNHTPTFPSVYVQQADGTWKLDTVTKPAYARIGSDGSIGYGDFLGYCLFSYVKEGGKSAPALCRDPRALFDSILEGYSFSRTIGSKQVRIRSLGDPIEKRSYIDARGRHWFAATWSLPQSDSVGLFFYLPTPSGTVGFFKTLSYGDLDDCLIDLEIASGFVSLGYSGSLSDWAEFLSADDLMPEAMKAWSLSYKAGAYVSLATPRFSFYQRSEGPAIADKSALLAQMGFFAEGEDVSWDVAGISLAEAGSTGASAGFLKVAKPVESASAPAVGNWASMLSGQAPFDGKAAKLTGYVAAFRTLPWTAPSGGAAPAFLYLAFGSSPSSSAGAEVERQASLIASALHLEDPELARMAGRAVEAKPEPAMVRIEGRSIFDAVRSGDRAALGAFIAAKADLGLSKADGETPLVAALLAGHADLAKDLLNAGAPTTGVSPEGESPLELAMDSRFGDLPARMLALGADAKAAAKDGRTPLGEAIAHGRSDLVRALLDAGAEPSPKPDSGGWTPLSIAVRYGDAGTLALLLSKGADLGSKTAGGWTVLHLAARFHPELLSSLIARRSDLIGSRARGGTTALSLAAQFAGADAVAALLDAGADPAAANDQGWTPLMFALRYGAEESARLLLGHAGALGGRTREGWEAAHFAARYRPALLPELLKAMATAKLAPRLDSTTVAGYSLLHLATVARNAEALGWLLGKGCSRSLKNETGQTALDLARAEEEPELAAILGK
jgi:ankyrin repeat protein